jgi:hypothetical protein
MSPTSPVPETGTIRSESVTSTRDSASLLAELATQAIALLQDADPHAVVTGLLRDKSYLHTQNGQLWKLVDKQRATYQIHEHVRVADILVSSSCSVVISKHYRIKLDTKLS